MANCCDKNPLQRNGINQQQRYQPSLKPGYISVDERDFADWIFFADEFSHYINYYDTKGTLSGNWDLFFASDISAILGSIAVQDVDVYRRSIKQRFDFIKDDENAANLPAVKQKLNELFSAILTLSKSFDNYLKKLPDKNIDGKTDFVFKTNLLNLIQTKLAPALKRLLRYYFAVDGVDENNVSDGSADYLENSDMAGWKVLNRQVEGAELTIWNDDLSSNWWSTGEPDWKTYVKNTALSPDISVFGPDAWLPDVYRRINHAVNHNLFSSVFDQYLQVYTRIVQDAEKTLLATLENWNIHPPHYALFLSFLKLFRFSQTQINTLTKRHLDFYYKEILQLRPKEAEPNHAHILVELAKPVDDYALEADTEFKAGKDSEGKEVLYTLDTETTFNKAKAVLLKTVYKGNDKGKDDHHLTEDPASLMVDNKYRLFASPVTNSDDGLGAKLRSANKEWHPYANKKFTDGQLTDIAMPDAQIGFALASHYLFLAEGERVIKIRLAAGADNSKLFNRSIECYLTTEKGWLKIADDTSTSISAIASGTMSEGSVSCAEFTITLHGEVPAITDYNAAIHGGTFNVSVPLLKVILKNDDLTSYQYEELKGIMITKTEIRVQVGNLTAYSQTGVKQLILSNDFGSIDAAKAFQPFGGQPARDNSLVIGSKEIFSKKKATIRCNLEWANLPADPFAIDYDPEDVNADYYPHTNLKYLAAGTWNNLNTDLSIFNASAQEVCFPSSAVSIPDKAIVKYKELYDSYQINDASGFIKISLKGDFGHKTFIDALSTYLIEKANKTSPATYSTKPFEPYTPLIKALSLSYSAYSIHALNENVKAKFDGREIQFFHIYPFGEAEQHAYLSGKNEDQFLLPQFTHNDPVSGTVYHSGEFYIGLEKLTAEQSVNILFQMMEGSSDPLVAKPEKHVHWSYLSNNKWLDFDDQQISDATLQLVQSGIISFVIPEEATTINNILPTGYLWIRAAVESAAEAICKLITIDAQAAVVTFSPHDNAADFLDTVLAAGTVSKLKIPTSSVKKVEQPYSSFGGRTKENSEKYYVRVSERLRHKARAITIWDYEHLVLEAFPAIHKVKCLNHTKFDINEQTKLVEYNEVAPGHVTIITIPDLKNRNDSNPLRPYTNQDVLSNIEEYLKEKISCHVNLKVKNPRFEEVWLSFKLMLMKGYDDFTFYSNQLKEEITQFLTPWAYNSDIDIQFGGKIQKSTLIDFIEERPYVDYILDVEMYHNTNPDNEDTGGCDEDKKDEKPGESGDLEEVEASTARSILVSVPAKKHNIDPVIIPPSATEAGCSGIINATPNAD
jgi:Baseplate J-like protein